MIQFYRVTKKYDEKQSVLSELSLDIQKGEFVFLTGKSGEIGRASCRERV